MSTKEPTAQYAFSDETPVGVMERAYAMAATLLLTAAQEAARRMQPDDIAEILNDATERGLLRPEAADYIRTGKPPVPRTVDGGPGRPSVPEAPEVTRDGNVVPFVPAGTRKH